MVGLQSKIFENFQLLERAGAGGEELDQSQQHHHHVCFQPRVQHQGVLLHLPGARASEQSLSRAQQCQQCQNKQGEDHVC